MRQTRITSRYAKSLLLISIEKDVLDEILNDMVFIQSVCSENKDFRSMLKSPIIKKDKKISIINKVFSSSLNKITMSFLKVITTKKREGYLEGISESFVNQCRIHNNIEQASVTTAVDMDQETRKEVMEFIEKHETKEIELKEIIDKTILGGIII